MTYKLLIYGDGLEKTHCVCLFRDGKRNTWTDVKDVYPNRIHEFINSIDIISDISEWLDAPNFDVEVREFDSIEQLASILEDILLIEELIK